METIRNFVVNASDWQSGYLAGAIITILLFILVFILVRILFHGRYASGVVQHAENGDIFISARSISDLIKSLHSGLPGIIINRVYLKKGKRGTFSLEISVDYYASDSQTQVKDSLEKLQTLSLESLRDVFGIDSVSAVRVGIRRTVHIKPEI